MADFNDRFSGAYYSFKGSNAGRKYSIATSMQDKDSIKLGGAMLNKANLIESSFPDQGTAQPSHLGSQSSTPDKDYQ